MTQKHCKNKQKLIFMSLEAKPNDLIVTSKEKLRKTVEHNTKTNRTNNNNDARELS